MQQTEAHMQIQASLTMADASRTEAHMQIQASLTMADASRAGYAGSHRPRKPRQVLLET
jgi:hypothetical protein